ncbi:TatD DNase family protein [Pilibacter termitis]|uniref:TatD DNase family protein n=1 Tax=Pilibacter termitis TaxID=263852 RepID=A0A1T4NNI4_9ENTE|nr:TatD family hydrolase [Pilibacter termitis]SJZ80328.1 TatD DNase family protein [Pilibacter termitis]
MIFDTHTHLNVKDFLGEEEEVLARARENGVTELAVVGFDKETIEKSLELSARFPNVYSIIGWHPTEAGSYSDEIENWLAPLYENEKVIAVGEIGLDYHWMEDPKDVQERVFRKQLEVARKLQLPFCIHTRDALEDTYEILKDENAGKIGGIMHSFSGDVAWAEKFLDLGLYISLSGVVTFKKAQELQEVAKMVPLNRLLVETDAPYLTPTPFRGKRNETGYTRYVVEKIAELRKMSVEDVARMTTENAHRIFGL